MTEPLSVKGTANPVINLIVMCVPISMKTNNDVYSSHIESYLFPWDLSSFFVNRIDYWIVGYWHTSTYEWWCCMK